MVTKFLHDELARIQKELKAPKSQVNDFSHFNYRSCEDIVEAVKPLLKGLSLILKDKIVCVGERYYVEATVSLSDGYGSIEATGYARESDEKRGMDAAQVTGSSSSYARKYALNGLFAIDDTKDADTMDNRERPALKTMKTVARPVAQAAGKPANTAGNACPECHAPAGKPHASGCNMGKNLTQRSCLGLGERLIVKAVKPSRRSKQVIRLTGESLKNV